MQSWPAATGGINMSSRAAGATAKPLHEALAASDPFHRKVIRSVPTPSVSGSSVATLTSALVGSGSIRIGRFQVQRPCQLRHPVSMPEDSRHHLFVVFQLKGRSVLAQHGRIMRLAPGNWGMCDAPTPCSASHLEAVEQLHFLIPADQIHLGCNIWQLVGRTYGVSERLPALMFQAVKALFDDLPQLEQRGAEDLADIVTRLLHLAVLERTTRQEPVSAYEEMRSRIHRYVEARLWDPHLSLDRIAADLNCTKRYLHMVFEGEQETITEYIWNRRLDGSRMEIQNPAVRKSIKEIAMGWGFSQLSHFSRSFRTRFGASPRELRARPPGAGAPG